MEQDGQVEMRDNYYYLIQNKTTENRYVQYVLKYTTYQSLLASEQPVPSLDNMTFTNILVLLILG